MSIRGLFRVQVIALPSEVGCAFFRMKWVDTSGGDAYNPHRCRRGGNRLLSGSNSAVECNLAKVEVAGSNPVSRSKESPRIACRFGGFFVLEADRCLERVVAWNAQGGPVARR